MRLLSFMAAVAILLPFQAAHAGKGELEKLWDANCDMMTFGQCGRNRNEKQAEVDLAKAEAAYEAALAGHNQKISGLQDRINDKIKDIGDWNNLIVKTPQIDKALTDLKKEAENALEQKQRTQTFLKRIFSVGKKSSQDIETIRNEFRQIQIDTTNNTVADGNRGELTLAATWQSHMDVLTKIADARQLNLQSYIDDAINAADGPALANLVSDLTIVEAFVKAVIEKVNQNIAARNQELVDLNAQLVAAQREPTPQKPVPPAEPKESFEEIESRIESYQQDRIGNPGI